jgi:hypothetical protein
MKNGKLILGVGAMVIAAIIISGVASAGWYCSEPTRVTQGIDNNGRVTMTVTTNVDDLWFYPSELGTIGECAQTHSIKGEAARNEIMTNKKVTADFYVYGVGYYPCTIDIMTGEITVILTGDNVPPVGSWVALRFCGVENDTYDKTVYVVLPGTLLNEFKVPGYGDEIPLSVLGVSPMY